MFLKGISALGLVMACMLFVACGLEATDEANTSVETAGQADSQQREQQLVNFLALRGGERVYIYAYGVAPTGGYSASWQAARFMMKEPDPDSMTTQALEPFVSVSMGFRFGSEASGIGFTMNGKQIEIDITEFMDVSDLAGGGQASVRALYRAISIDGSAYVFAFGVYPPDVADLYWEGNHLMAGPLESDAEFVPASAVSEPIIIEASAASVMIVDADGEKSVDLN